MEAVWLGMLKTSPSRSPQPIVHLTKTWHDSPEELVEAVEAACAGAVGNDFVDAVAISEQVCMARLIESGKWQICQE
jgi:hypothetical protein